MNGNTEFVEGLRIYAPNERAPDYIIANGEIDIAALRSWLNRDGDKVRIVIKRSQGGKYYAAVDTYKRDAEQPSRAPVKGCPQPERDGFEDSDIPF